MSDSIFSENLDFERRFVEYRVLNSFFSENRPKARSRSLIRRSSNKVKKKISEVNEADNCVIN